jgi:hypothetical protein
MMEREQGRKRKKRERKKRKRKGRKKGLKFFQTWKFSRGNIKDNFWSWSKNYFCKRKEYA